MYGYFENKPQATEDLSYDKYYHQKKIFSLSGGWSAFRTTFNCLLQTRVFVEAGENEQ